MWTVTAIFKPPPPVGAGRGYMFSGRPSVPLSVHLSVRDSRGSFMFPRYLQYLLMDFRQTFVTGASWDTDDLITFWGQKVKVQGHTIAAEAHSTQRYRRVQLFLIFTFESSSFQNKVAGIPFAFLSEKEGICTTKSFCCGGSVMSCHKNRLYFTIPFQRQQVSVWQSFNYSKDRLHQQNLNPYLFKYHLSLSVAELPS